MRFNIIFLAIIFSLFFLNLLANEKKLIINKLNETKSLEFNFLQEVNDKKENGICVLEFPGNLKCNYSDDKKKELVISENKMVISQKRYDKSYFYPVSKSPFLKILYKDSLFEIINLGKIDISNETIKLTYINESKIIVLFDKNSLELRGWQIIDQYNNLVNFSIKIIGKNRVLNKNTFKLPTIN